MTTTLPTAPSISAAGDTLHRILSAAPAAPDGDGGFSWGTLLLFVGGAFLLAVVSGLGILARMRDRRHEMRRLEREQARREADATAAPTDPRPDALPGS